MPDLTGKTFVMTGRFSRFKSREIVADMIRAAGGAVANKVTANTTALITNTPNSGTKKTRTPASTVSMSSPSKSSTTRPASSTSLKTQRKTKRAAH